MCVHFHGHEQYQTAHELLCDKNPNPNPIADRNLSVMDLRFVWRIAVVKSYQQVKKDVYLGYARS